MNHDLSDLGGLTETDVWPIVQVLPGEGRLLYSPKMKSVCLVFQDALQVSHYNANEENMLHAQPLWAHARGSGPVRSFAAILEPGKWYIFQAK